MTPMPKASTQRLQTQLKTLSRVHFSSATPEWETPQALFDELDRIFGGFTLDPCATPENAKCSRYFTGADDGLIQHWTGKVFMNRLTGVKSASGLRKPGANRLTAHSWCVSCPPVWIRAGGTIMPATDTSISCAGGSSLATLPTALRFPRPSSFSESSSDEEKTCPNATKFSIDRSWP
jgi:hypothetical protein